MNKSQDKIYLPSQNEMEKKYLHKLQLKNSINRFEVSQIFRMATFHMCFEFCEQNMSSWLAKNAKWIYIGNV